MKQVQIWPLWRLRGRGWVWTGFPRRWRGANALISILSRLNCEGLALPQSERHWGARPRPNQPWTLCLFSSTMLKENTHQLSDQADILVDLVEQNLCVSVRDLIHTQRKQGFPSKADMTIQKFLPSKCCIGALRGDHVTRTRHMKHEGKAELGAGRGSVDEVLTLQAWGPKLISRI